MKSLMIVLAYAVLLVPSSAMAQTFTGEWPENDRPVTVTIHHQPLSVAMGKVAKAAGLELMMSLPTDPVVDMDIKKRTLRTVLELMLRDQPIVVDRQGTLIVVRPAPAAAAAAPTPAAAPEKVAAAPVADPETEAPVPAPKERTGPILGDRSSYGGDVTVEAHERVKSVASFGGDVEIAGEVMQDVSSAGGDVELEPGAIVHGNILSFGGDVDVAEDAVVYGEVVPVGGELYVAKGGVAREGTEAKTKYGPFTISGSKNKKNNYVGLGTGGEVDDDDDHHWSNDPRHVLSEAGDFVSDVLGNVTKCGLLFLFALFMLAAFPGRLESVRAELTAHPLRSGIIGWAGLVGAAILMLVLCITIIGIPVAVVVALALPIAMLVGITASAWWLGSLLPFEKLKERPAFGAAAGVGIFLVCSFLGPLGAFILINAALFGFGAVLSVVHSERRARKSTPPPAVVTP